MTSTDTPTNPHPVPPFAMVPFDLYRDIHKGIRTELFDVTAAAGRLDPSDRVERVAHATRVREVVQFLVSHAEHEDRHIEPALRAVAPELAEEIHVDHVALDATMGDLIDVADLAFADGRHDARAAVHELYLALGDFTARYLRHQSTEERTVMPRLFEALGFDAVLMVHRAILADIAPDEMGASLAVMLPAMNADDRTELLGGMKAEAPAEAFAGVWALAGQVLAPRDVAQLAERLDVSPVTTSVAAGR